MARFKLDEAVNLLEDTKPLTDYFGVSAKVAVMSAMKDLVGDAKDISLRDIHAAATVAAFVVQLRGL